VRTKFTGAIGMAAAVAAIGATALTAAPAQAASAHTEYHYSGGRYLQANVWLGAGQSFSWTTSTKYLGSGSGPSTASKITNKVLISVTGLGVSLGNASGGTSSDKDFGATWTNTNARIADLAGSNRVSNNFYLYITGNSSGSATIPYFGSSRSVAVSAQKWA
jgi:hypothetical protein